MAEELKGLIEKIQTEGIQAAEKKAAEIVKEAGEKAAAIEEKAKESAARLVADAGNEIQRMEGSSRASLKQAARDTVITLKKNIAALLDSIVRRHVQEALTSEEMARMIGGLVKAAGETGKGAVVLTLGEGEEERVRRALLAELGETAARGITVKSSPDIRGGFLISFDKGSSSYDFTDRSVAEYLASVVKPELGKILNEAFAEGSR